MIEFKCRYIVFMLCPTTDDPERAPLYKTPTERKDSLSSDKPQPILVKKKSSLIDKKRVSSAKVGIFLNLYKKVL